MKRTIEIEDNDLEWLQRELSFKLDMENARKRFARANAMDQIASNIAVQERLLKALSA